MADDILEKIRVATAGTTPGPWRPCPNKMFIFGPSYEMIASTSKGYPEDVEVGAQKGTVEIRGAGAGLPMDQNHDFIVASRELIDEAAAEITRLRALVATLR